MNKIKIAQIIGSICAVIAIMPGAHRAAVHFEAYELLWLICFVPAFTVTLFWIIIVMVGHFIVADSYKDPQAIHQAKSFLSFFNCLFVVVLILFMITGFFLQTYF